ncbi:hypothetical protein EKK58_07430 [Candidatus Dependentiae bacterium]|nr:MAG: hypothetical protein EKK58_07430 [Candidatus Dependentiae bacterium]
MPDNDEIFEDIVTRQVLSMRLDAKIREDILKDLKKLEKKIIQEISDSDPSGQSFRSKRLNALLKSVRVLIEDAYEEISENFKESVVEFIRLEALKTEKVLASTVQVSTTAISVEKLKQIYSDTLINGAPSSEWWNRQSEKTRQLFEDNMREGLLRGETNEELIRRVRGSKAFKFSDGIFNTSRKEAEALVRTSVQSVANAARLSTFDANDDIISSYRHISTLDSKTSDTCIARDGLRWKADKKRTPIGHKIPFRQPPLHWNCRSTIIPEIEGVNLLDNAERASVDGPVKASITFDEFLKSKTKGFQDDLLGKGKAELWRKKKITLRQLVDQSGNPLTLAELKSKYDK